MITTLTREDVEGVCSTIRVERVGGLEDQDLIELEWLAKLGVAVRDMIESGRLDLRDVMTAYGEEAIVNTGFDPDA